MTDAKEPTVQELHHALDQLHMVCECSRPEVYSWYCNDPFAQAARQEAIEVLNRHWEAH